MGSPDRYFQTVRTSFPETAADAGISDTERRRADSNRCTLLDQEIPANHRICDFCGLDEGIAFSPIVPELWVCASCTQPAVPDDLPETPETTPGRPGYVYFIQEGKSGKVKIGWAVTPRDRLTQLQVGNPRALRLVKTLPCKRRYYERELQWFYADHRIVREWFSPAVLEIEPPDEKDVYKGWRRFDKRRLTIVRDASS